MKNDFFVDIHCHPSMKPFGKSFTKAGKPGKNNSDRKHKDSIWHYNPPSFIDKVLNQALKVTKFSQSDFSAGSYANVKVVCASLYPIERSFCRNKMGQSIVSDLPANFATGFGKNRIDVIQDFNSAAYFTDLQAEYKFLLALDGQQVTLTDNRRYTYRIVKSYAELEALLQDENPEAETLAVIVTIEGAHAFGCGVDGNATIDILRGNIQTVKQWDHPPFFITFAHHFYNELCGHAESLAGLLKSVTDQSEGMDQGFTPLGKEAVKLLLDKASGKRILIDIKHMSVQARQEYYALLENEYPNEKIPIIVSHGCVQGNAKDAHKFNTASINFSDQDILKVAASGGLLGIQLDERRIASDALLRYARSFTKRTKVLYHWAELVWNQVQHVAELLDSNGYFAWGNMCMGTDFDGIIDPINGYWTHEDIPDLESYLLMHASNYMKAGPALSPDNKIHEEEIVNRIMRSNAVDFFKAHFV